MSENKSIVLEGLKENQSKVEKKINQPDVVASVQKLLAYEDQQDRHILGKLGLDDEIRYAENLHGKRIELEKLNNEFKGQIFSAEAIKALCVNYRLRLLPSNFFRGKVDVEVTAKIKEFAKECGIELNEHNLTSKFYIMAPDKSFAKQRVEIPKRVPQNLDPVLFFKVDDEHYRMIHKWGNDFSVLRAIVGWKWKSEGRHFMFGIFLSAIIVTLLCSIILPASMIAAHWGYWVALTLGTFVGGWIHHTTNVKNDEFISQNLTVNNWNNNQEFF